MKMLIKNCTLVSMDEKRERIEKNKDILIDGNKIVEIGEGLKGNFDKVIDASNKVVMPGLINTHSHIPMSIFRETVDGYITQDWLEKKIWPMEDKLTYDDVYYASLLSYAEMIKTGTTTACDMYFITDAIIDAMKDSGVRLQTSRTLMDIAGGSVGERYLKELTELIKKYENTDRLTFNTSIHGLYTCSMDAIDMFLKFSKDNNLNIQMHFCENSKELDDIKNLHNDLPIEILKNKFKGHKLLLAHCVKVSDADIDVFKDMDVSVAHCPVSNLRLGCGVANVNYMLEQGVNVALGTDGQGSGSNMDMFETMKYAALLQKGILEDPTKIEAYEVLKMATVNGAKALGLEDEVGSIEIGKKADLIIIDIDSILTKPVNDLISQLVYNVKGSNVDTTIVDGNILMENKKINSIDVEAVIKECEKAIDRISID